MSVVGCGFFFIFGLLYLAAIVGAIVAVVVSVLSFLRMARALERIAGAQERRPPT
ncbi:MAG: hypothetical protein WB682_07170 [Candidatus Dormiibacterota bacterium]